MNTQQPQGRELFERELQIIEQAVAATIRRRRFQAEDAEEFRAWARLRLLEDDCAILRKFEGRSSLETYLHIVVNRLALDYRVAQWGKWRPSAAAQREGAPAVLLERLVERDGFGRDEALRMLTDNYGLAPAQLPSAPPPPRQPSRAPRRLETLSGIDAWLQDATPDPIEEAERVETARRLGSSLGKRLVELPPEDRELLALRFAHGETVTSIASQMGVPRRRLYYRIERCLSKLRNALERDGITASDVRAGTGCSAAAMDAALARTPRRSFGAAPAG